MLICSRSKEQTSGVTYLLRWHVKVNHSQPGGQKIREGKRLAERRRCVGVQIERKELGFHHCVILPHHLSWRDHKHLIQLYSHSCKATAAATNHVNQDTLSEDDWNGKNDWRQVISLPQTAHMYDENCNQTKTTYLTAKKLKKIIIWKYNQEGLNVSISHVLDVFRTLLQKCFQCL